MKKRMITFLMIFGGLLTFWALVVGYNLMTGPHTDLGVVDGRLTPAPRSPNAVSSYATDEEHGMEPLKFDGTSSEAMKQVAAVVEAMPRSNIVEQKAGYLRAEFQSALFRFIDDVEFLHDESAGLLHFRSAARLGHSDMGANRARMEEFASRFEANQKQ